MMQSPTNNATLSSALSTSTQPTETTPTDDLFHQFDKTLEGCLEDEWKASIIMQLDRNACGQLTPIDICDHLGGKFKNQSLSDTFYFDRTKYPPPQSDVLDTEQDRSTFNELKVAIRRWSFDAGSKVISNGSGGKPRIRRFKCSYCSRVYRPYQNKKEGLHRKDCIVGSDKKGRRFDGRSLPRRTHTSLSLDKNKICPFNFCVSWNEIGYHLSPTGAITCTSTTQELILNLLRFLVI